MWQRLLISLGLFFTIEKLFGKNKIDCYRKPCWFFFDKTGMIREYRPATDGKDRFYITDDNPLGWKEIDWNSDLGLLARLVFCEGGAESLKCKWAIAETIRNRVNSKCFPNSYRDVIFQTTPSLQFACIYHDRFLKTKDIIKNPVEKEDYLASLLVAIKVLYQNTYKFPSDLLFFNIGTAPANDLIKYQLQCKNNFYRKPQC